MDGIAIIIPVLDDAVALRKLLDEIGRWADQPAEILIVAGDDDPTVDALSGARNCRRIRSRASRGVQLDDGARATEARTLWFLHADAEPSPTALTTIERARAGGAEAGYFRFRFSGPRSWRKSLSEALVALRLRCGGVPDGDQGLWVDRAAYEACGGFAREPLFEEVRLVRQLRARGHFVCLDEPIGISPRRWERDGWWLRSGRNRLLALGFALGVPAARLARRYYPQSRFIKDARP